MLLHTCTHLQSASTAPSTGYACSRMHTHAQRMHTHAQRMHSLFMVLRWRFV
jgi:hypothetical protein